MIGEKFVLAVIQARSGSQSIKDKNIAPLGGRPLIAWAIDSATKCGLVDAVIVSTDSQHYGSLAQRYGAEVPFLRPSEISGPDVWSRDSLRWAVLEYEKARDLRVDYVVEVPAVAPFRTSDDIGRVLLALHSGDHSSAISVCRMVDKHPRRLKVLDKSGNIRDICDHWVESGGCSLKQNLTPHVFIRNGAVYAMRRETLIDLGTRIGPSPLGVEAPEDRSLNIDTPQDLFSARGIVRSRLYSFPENRARVAICSPDADVLVTAPVHFMSDGTQSMLRSANAALCYRSNIGPDVLSSVRFYVCDPGHSRKIDSEDFARMPRLRKLLTPSTGATHINVDAAMERGIGLWTLHDAPEVKESISASSEFTLALILSTCRNLVPASQAALDGQWREREDCFRGFEIQGSSVGLIGFGRIGQRIGRALAGLGARVRYYDPNVPDGDSGATRSASLRNLADCRIVVCCAALTGDSRRSITYNSLFSHMRPGSVFINTSRGELIDACGLIRAIKENLISRAAVDVVDSEQSEFLPFDELIRFANDDPRLTVTPHIAGLTVESQEKAMVAALRHIAAEVSS